MSRIVASIGLLAALALVGGCGGSRPVAAPADERIVVSDADAYFVAPGAETTVELGFGIAAKAEAPKDSGLTVRVSEDGKKIIVAAAKNAKKARHTVKVSTAKGASDTFVVDIGGDPSNYGKTRVEQPHGYKRK
jgi:hypothetical protein